MDQAGNRSTGSPAARHGVDAPSGTVDAPVHCDGVPHTVALIAFDAKGARTSQVKLLAAVSS